MFVAAGEDLFVMAFSVDGESDVCAEGDVFFCLEFPVMVAVEAVDFEGGLPCFYVELPEVGEFGCVFVVVADDSEAEPDGVLLFVSGEGFV